MIRFYEDIVLPRGVYSIGEPASQINGIRPVNDFIQSKFLEDKSNSTLTSIDKCYFFNNNSNSTFESNLRSTFAKSV